MTINTKLVKLPCRIKAAAVQNEDGSHTIILNPLHTFEQLRKSYLHEVKHIENDDFFKFDVDDIESDAHQI